MPPQDDAKTKLETWTEIACYLDVTVRTAQTWEKTQGMPVHRMNGERARVWAYAEELTEWHHRFHRVFPLESAAVNQSSEAVAAAPTHVTPVGTAWMPQFWVRLHQHRRVVAALILLAFGALGILFARSDEPARFRLDQNRLVVSDRRGHFIWEHAFPKFFWSQDLAPENQAGLVWIGRLGTSGESRVLANYAPSDVFEVGTTLYCFSRTGRELWKFAPNRVVKTASEAFQPVYITNGYLVLPDGRIAVASHQHPWYPAQLALLSPQGKLLAEYWHSGYIVLLKSSDVDGDGKPELIVAGINNGYHAATLLVLSPDDLEGAAAQPPDDPTQLVGMAPGHEKVRILMPMSDISRAVGMNYNAPAALEVGPTGIELLVMEDGGLHGGGVVHYTFDYKFRLVSVRPSDTFVHVHRELELAGILKHPFSQTEIDELRKSVVVLRNDYR